MKSLRFFALAALLVTACTAPSTPEAATPIAHTISEREAIAVSDKLFQALIVEQDFAKATADFDSQMKAALPDTRLEATWNALLAQSGAFHERGEARVLDRVEPYIRVVTPLAFEKADLDMRVVVDSNTGRVSGLFFAPAVRYEAPAYADAGAFEEQDVTIGEGEWQLPGTLAMPKGDGPFPAMVLVHGSGPNDRDETLGPNKPFKDLAWGLATRGVAVLRYDKRTQVHGEKFAALEGATVREETIDDALLAVALLEQTARIDLERIFVLGHSLGGTLAPRIAQADPELAGIIILAGATRPLEDLIVEQSEYIASLDGDLSIAERQQIEAIQQEAARVKALTDADAAGTNLILGAPVPYWLDLSRHDPAETASTLSIPILILQGERDYQVTPKDFEGWRAALASRANATFRAYPELNHLFMAGEGRSTPDEYETAGHVAQEVIDDIAAWIVQQR